MRSSVTMNPTGGVTWRRDIVLPDPGDPLQFVKELQVWSLTARLRLGRLWEPPGADPHAGWCGGWGRKTPGYPIGTSLIFYNQGQTPHLFLKTLLLFIKILASKKWHRKPDPLKGIVRPTWILYRQYSRRGQTRVSLLNSIGHPLLLPVPVLLSPLCQF